jgi:hypothetical protein
MKNEILEEINRMKVLGGILSEASGPTQVLPRVIATLTRTALDDAILSAFATLENKGLITINKSTKAITRVNWNIMSPDELKLLFSAEPVRKIFLDATTDLGVDITSSAQRASFIGKPFGKILKGYDDAAGSIISTGGSSAGGKVGMTAANIAIDVESHITKYFPNITSDKNIFNSLVNDIKPNLVNLDTNGQINFITNKCTSLEKQIGESLKNLDNQDSQESAAAMKKGLEAVKVIKQKLKKYGPISYNNRDKVQWWSTIQKSLAWIVATDILVLGYFESRKTGGNLADTMFKRVGDRASFILGLFLGTTPEKKTEPEKNNNNNNVDWSKYKPQN